MNIKLTKWSAFLAAIIIIAISSCSSSKKFDYASAYKFRTIKHTPKNSEEKTKEPLADAQLLASTEITQNEELGKEIEKSQNELLEKVGLVSKGENLSKKEIAERIQNLDKKEKRKIRKELVRELKAEMKEVKRMEKSDVTSTATTQDIDVSGYTRVGIIMGGLGIIVLILGALFGVGALSIAGALLILGGVVFILIDLLQ